MATTQSEKKAAPAKAPAKNKAPAPEVPSRSEPAGNEPAANEPGPRFYRVLADCRVGHLRRTGEVFSWPAFEECPGHLEEVDEEEAARLNAPARERGKAPSGPAGSWSEESGFGGPAGDDLPAEERTPGATLADLGFGPAQSVGDVTSADMINQ